MHSYSIANINSRSDVFFIMNHIDFLCCNKKIGNRIQIYSKRLIYYLMKNLSNCIIYNLSFYYIFNNENITHWLLYFFIIKHDLCNFKLSRKKTYWGGLSLFTIQFRVNISGTLI